MGHARWLAVGWVAVALVARWAAADAYDPPAGYYDTATGTGAMLKSQLTTIMSTGHIQRTYGDFRFSAVTHDADPNIPGNILLMYTRQSVDGAWDPDVPFWNREHVWPIALQGGSDPSNSTTGHRADPHALRPANPTINSNRGNKPFGLDVAGSAGVHGPVPGGIYYYPGDADIGDTARSLFYSTTRYSSLGLTLVDTVPGSFQMGDLSSLIAWHYADPPDEFERRRNHRIYSQAENPTYYTNNRNAFTDRPEFVWSVFVDQANDSRIAIDGVTVGGDGASTQSVDFGRVFVGGAVPAAQSLTLNKTGIDGTYFEVTTAGAATSSLAGRFNAFRTDQTDSRSITVGLNTSTVTSGMKTGTVTIDNLDVTTDGGADRGANDANDTVNFSLTVLDHGVASFSFNNEQRQRIIDFGTVPLGGGLQSSGGSINNLAAFGAPDFAANLDLDSISGSGDTGVFDTGISPFSDLAQGDFVSFYPSFTPSSVGQFEAQYTLDLSDEDLPGEQFQSLSLVLTAEVILVGDYNRDNVVDVADYTVWRDSFGDSVAAYDGADGSGNLLVDDDDYQVWKAHFGETAGSGSVGALPSQAAVPEPVAAALMTLGAAATVAFRGRRRASS